MAIKLKLPADRRGRIQLAGTVFAAVMICWALYAGFYRLFVLPREAASTKAEAVSQTEAVKATASAGASALQTVTEVRREVVRIEATTRSNDHAIKTAAGASTRAPGVAAALRDSLCRRAAYHGEPDCVAVRGDGGELGPAGPDVGSDAPAE